MRIKRWKLLLAALTFAIIVPPPAIPGLAGNQSVSYAAPESGILDIIIDSEPSDADDEEGDEADSGQADAAVQAAPDTQASHDYSELSAKYADLTQEEKAEILNRLGLLLGDPNRGLMLDIKVRRSDAAVFFTRLLGREQFVKDRAETDFAASRFPDAPEGKWFTPYVSFCASIGIVAGRTDGYYYPDENISEKEFANVLLKILGYEYQVDYTWDTVYEFSYDIGLFDDPSYAAKKEDNREYYRRDVCDQVFAVLGLEKKNSPKLLIEELVETGAISEKAAADLGFDLSGLEISILQQPGDGDGDYSSVEADIQAIYHLEKDLLLIVFTKPVAFRNDAIEICQTYDYSKVLSSNVEDKSERDLLLRTAAQIPNMDYTIDIGNVLETNGANAGMLSFDFVGYDPGAAKDTPAGLTSLKRNEIIPASSAKKTTAGGASGGADKSGDSAAAQGNASGDASGGATGKKTAATTSGTGTGTGAGAEAGSAQSSKNTSSAVDYFRIINAYTTASDEVALYFSHPVSEAALNPSLYNVTQNGSIRCSGPAGQIKTELIENAVNAVRLITPGFEFMRGAEYGVTASGRLVSSYTARLNEGAEDSFFFTADVVTKKASNFMLNAVGTNSQYTIELEFSQPVNADVARQSYNYIVHDQNGRKIDISVVTVIPDGNSAGIGHADGKLVRISLTQPLLVSQSNKLTIIYTANSSKTESIANQSYQFTYGGQADAVQKSTVALTGALSNDASTAELYFSQKLDPTSAVVAANYSINGIFNGRAAAVTPVKVSYNPALTPYMVRLYLPMDQRFAKDTLYSVRINNSIRDDRRLNPDRTLEMQFFANNREPVNPELADAVYIGEGIVRLEFSKEILFDPSILSESNYTLIEAVGAASVPEAELSRSADAVISPMLVKFINTTTIILRFDFIDTARKYRVYFSSLTDFSGQYTTRYPDRGSSAALRIGTR